MHISRTKQAAGRAITSLALLAAVSSPVACLGRYDCTGASGLCLYPGTAADGGGQGASADGAGADAGAGRMAEVIGGSIAATAGSSADGTAGSTTHELRLPVDSTGGVGASFIGIGGGWYPYADAYDTKGTTTDGPCEVAGHPASDCAAILTPTDLLEGIPNRGGVLCTSGSVERVLDTAAFPKGDYGNMWGAGIGFVFHFDANLPTGSDAPRIPYDARVHGVVGLAFDLDQVPVGGLRVEFLTSSATRDAAIWKEGAGSNSPVQVGHNTILFADVNPASYSKTPVAFDSAQLLALQLHITTNTDPASARPYAFCVRNFSLVVED